MVMVINGVIKVIVCEKFQYIDCLSKLLRQILDIHISVIARVWLCCY